MKEIKLSTMGANRGKFVSMVDDCDFEYLNSFNWHVQKHGNTHYALRNDRVGDIQKSICMHRVVLEITNKLIVCDHIDGNGLNNQRCNLRTCTQHQNSFNSKMWKKSKYKGTYRNGNKSGKIFNCQIRCGKQIYLGRFETEEEAAKVYDKAAKIYFGEYAQLNFPLE